MIRYERAKVTLLFPPAGDRALDLALALALADGLLAPVSGEAAEMTAGDDGGKRRASAAAVEAAAEWRPRDAPEVLPWPGAWCGRASGWFPTPGSGSDAAGASQGHGRRANRAAGHNVEQRG